MSHQQKITIQGQARTANPVATSNRDSVDFALDDLGRQITVPHQVRDLIFTASAATATLAEVTLLTGTAGVFNDLIEITCANASGAAVSISVRDATAAGVVKTIQIPASDTKSRDFPVPIPQGVAADTWTIQNAGSGDVSGTVVTCSALFVRNV